MAELDRQATELETLMHSLSFADEGAGVVQTANTTMRQKDIDFLVAILQELQEYREIGTAEECRAYKAKALG
ncbi:MAG: hypothetical protein J6N53_16580 [Lachnospiraceae bacterium]|nr:hypothetical protein [Lachnospiraceae bacterium]MBO6208976.1 hypothetical protein [Lachnospiraceae bacterium]MBO6300448.1 hypothetical protein [Lachnospiraceae bacterium]MBP3296621.1 hypothetical protein [Lachnospiraceae bacterium]MCR5128275.1 hypothetical protein [Lachnospiraceae bacterium]